MSTALPPLHSTPGERAWVVVILVLSFLVLVASVIAVPYLTANRKQPLEAVRVYDRAAILSSDSLYRSLKSHLVDEELAVLVVSVEGGGREDRDAQLWDFLGGHPHASKWLTPAAVEEDYPFPPTPDPRLKGRVIVVAVSAHDELWAAISPEICGSEGDCADLMRAVYWDSDARSPDDAVKAVVSRQIERIDSGRLWSVLLLFFAITGGGIALTTVLEIDSRGANNRKNLGRVMAQYRDLEGQSLMRFKEVENILVADLDALDALAGYQRYVEGVAAWEKAMDDYLPLGFLESLTAAAETAVNRFQSALEALETLSEEREGIANLITRNAAGIQRWKEHSDCVRESIRAYRDMCFKAREAESGSVLTKEDIPPATYSALLEAINQDYREQRVDIAEAFLRLRTLRRDVASSAWKLAIRHCVQETLLLEEGTLDVDAHLYETTVARVEEAFSNELLKRSGQNDRKGLIPEEEYFLSLRGQDREGTGEISAAEHESFFGSVGVMRSIYASRILWLSCANSRIE